MYGGNAVTSSWGNPQQNQQQSQQPAGSAFGQPSGFGSTGAFGQNQQQPQPQANPMFGNLGGATGTNSGASGFGTFGGANNSQNNAANPMFGGAKPATGFGAFGGANGTFGGGGTFGQNTNNAAGPSGTNTGLFGQPAATNTGGFGANTGLFGNKPTTGFGTTQTNPQAGTYDNIPLVTTGSSNPPYNVFTEKDTSPPNVVLQYQAISCMPAYRGSSFEELRLQDYAQGRKTAGAFGQSAAFGNTQPTNTGLFGTQPAQQNPAQPSIFGAPAANQTTTSAFGPFGQTPANQPATAPASTGLFGSAAFGQTQQQPQQQTTGFGTFGQPAQQQTQQQQQAGGLFGSGGAFGTTSKPAFSAFSGGGGGAFSGGGAGVFGQQNQQQQQQPTTGLFGQSQPAAPTTGFGAFGNNTANNQQKSIFGQPAQPAAQPAQGGFGLFGQQQQNQQGQQPQPQQPSIFGSGGGSLFGNNNQQQQQQQQNQQPANSLFGNPTAQPAGTSLFGNSLFNSNQQPQNQQQPAQPNNFGLFGTNKPAAPAAQPSIFSNFAQPQNGNNAAPQQSIFGNSLGQPGNQQSGLGGGLFGKPAAPLVSSSNSTGQGGGFNSFAPTASFNASANTSGAQGSLTASISQPIGANLPIFSMLPPGPRAVNLDQSQPKKKAGFFVDIPTRSPVPRVQLGYTPANSKLRGFGSSNSSSSLGGGGGNPFAGLSFSSGKPNALSLSRAVDNKTPVGPDAFLGRSSSPSLGSGGRHSVKKLILDKKVEPSDLFNKSGSSPGALRGGGKVTFSPALSVAAREKEAVASAASPLNRPSESPTPTTRNQRTSPNRFTAQNNQNILQLQPPDDNSAPSALQEGDYWVKPDLPTLVLAGFDQLSSFKDLVVGRIGYGEIHFLEPVDLTGLPKLGALLGEVVRFDDKECSVYPDCDEVDKPPPGSGLNVRAKVTLVRCWAVDKATREPIKDATLSIAIKHLKRLKNMKDTHFESFDISEGKWTFIVDHF